MQACMIGQGPLDVRVHARSVTVFDTASDMEGGELRALPRRAFFRASRELQACMIGQGPLDVRVDDERRGCGSARVSLGIRG